jgi:outer membrane protein OmpA-like peptidoglycan-associated protein
VAATSVSGDGKRSPSLPPPDTSVADPVVPFGSGKVTVYSVPSAALFDTGRSVVRAEAQPLLVRIAVSIRTGTHKRVDVKGYADPRGSAQDNQALSGARARAVADVLAANGVDNVHPAGEGETTTCPYAVDVPANASEDDKLQCFRRVDIVVS